MQLSRLLRSQNPDAELRPETWNRIPNAVFLRGLRGSQTLMLDLQTNVLPSPLPHSHGENRQGFLHRMLLRRELSAVTLRCEKCYTPTELSRRVEQVTSATGQTILRGKGIVRTTDGFQLVQYVPGELKIEPISVEGNCICFIGTGLNEEKVRTQFLSI